MRERASAPRSSAHGVFWALHGARAASTATATTMSGMRRISILPSSCASRLCGLCGACLQPTGQSGQKERGAPRCPTPAAAPRPRASPPPHTPRAHSIQPSNSSPAATCAVAKGPALAAAPAQVLHANKQRSKAKTECCDEYVLLCWVCWAPPRVACSLHLAGPACVTAAEWLRAGHNQELHLSLSHTHSLSLSPPWQP